VAGGEYRCDAVGVGSSKGFLVDCSRKRALIPLISGSTKKGAFIAPLLCQFALLHALI